MFSACKEENLAQRKVGISVAFSWQELVYQLLEQIITQIFKNTRSFVHWKAAQWDFVVGYKIVISQYTRTISASSALPWTWLRYCTRTGV